MKKTYRKRATKSAPKRKYAKRVYKKTSFAARVKKVLHSQIENKIYVNTGINQNLAYAGSVTNPTYLNLTPFLGNTNDQGGRIGNQVNVVKGTIRGRINMLPYSAVSNPSDVPILIKMWVCRRKSNNIGDGDVPVTSDWAQFFQSGNASLPFQANALDMLLHPNNDYWTVYATKTMTLSNFSAPDTTTTLTPQSSRVTMPFSFSFAKHLGKLKYNDSAAGRPSNKELFLVFQGVRCDGATQTIGTFAEVHYVTEIEFEDA